MKKIAIFYGSNSGNTKTVAASIQEKLNGNDVELIDVAKAKTEDIDRFNNLILGTSTWGVGDLQDDWEVFLPVLAKANLGGKVIALFGLGDASTYADSFVDGMGVIYDAIKDKGCKIVGTVKTEGYSFDASKAEKNGSFVGLPIDEDNDANLTDSRLENWIVQITNEFK